jgi:energy-coupling factor transporter ATP-binding protein EcfA2
MFARLGFAVAAHVDPEVLLVDEVLAVGDMAFRRKCYERMIQLIKKGTTLVFVSHDFGAVQKVCARCLVMYRGNLAFDGTCRRRPSIPISWCGQSGSSCTLRMVEACSDGDDPYCTEGIQLLHEMGSRAGVWVRRDHACNGVCSGTRYSADRLHVALAGWAIIYDYHPLGRTGHT